MTLEEFKNMARYGHNVKPNDRIWAKDYTLYMEAMDRRWAYNTPLVGDYVRMPNGYLLRCAYDWGDSMQLCVHGEFSLHPDTGKMSMSGSLEPSIHKDLIIPVGHHRDATEADCWFFSTNYWGAHRGCYVKMPVRTWGIKPGGILPHSYDPYVLPENRMND